SNSVPFPNERGLRRRAVPVTLTGDRQAGRCLRLPGVCHYRRDHDGDRIACCSIHRERVYWYEAEPPGPSTNTGHGNLTRLAKLLTRHRVSTILRVANLSANIREPKRRHPTTEQAVPENLD